MSLKTKLIVLSSILSFHLMAADSQDSTSNPILASTKGTQVSLVTTKDRIEEVVGPIFEISQHPIKTIAQIAIGSLNVADRNPVEGASMVVTGSVINPALAGTSLGLTTLGGTLEAGGYKATKEKLLAESQDFYSSGTLGVNIEIAINEIQNKTQLSTEESVNLLVQTLESIN